MVRLRSPEPGRGQSLQSVAGRNLGEGGPRRPLQVVARRRDHYFLPFRRFGPGCSGPVFPVAAPGPALASARRFLRLYSDWSWQFPVGLLALTVVNYLIARRLWKGAGKFWLWGESSPMWLALGLLKIRRFFPFRSDEGCAGLYPAMLAVMVAPTVGINRWTRCGSQRWWRL